MNACIRKKKGARGLIRLIVVFALCAVFASFTGCSAGKGLIELEVPVSGNAAEKLTISVDTSAGYKVAQENDEEREWRKPFVVTKKGKEIISGWASDGEDIDNIENIKGNVPVSLANDIGSIYNLGIGITPEGKGVVFFKGDNSYGDEMDQFSTYCFRVQNSSVYIFMHFSEEFDIQEIRDAFEATTFFVE